MPVSMGSVVPVSPVGVPVVSVSVSVMVPVCPVSRAAESTASTGGRVSVPICTVSVVVGAVVSESPLQAISARARSMAAARGEWAR